MDFLNMPRTNDKKIDLTKLKFNICLRGNLKDSKYAENFIMFEEDKSIALLKTPLYLVPSYSGVYPSGKIKIQPDEYNPLLAKQIANIANIPCAEYYLAQFEKDTYILTPSFLNEGEELILGTNISDKDEFDINKILKNIDLSLTRRRYNQNEIKKVKEDFIKQCFVSKFIGNLDEQPRNFGIILNGRHIRLAPLFDLEYSFEIISESLGYERNINGDISLKGLIESFKDYPGFIQFVKKFNNKLDIKKIFDSVEEDTGIPVNGFLEKQYTDFLTGKLNESRKAIKDIEKGEYLL